MNQPGNISLNSLPRISPIQPGVLRLGDQCQAEVSALLQSVGLVLVHVSSQQDIPGSYWGDAEAGLIRNQLLARDDTPVHSVLHEACHFLCMDDNRRNGLHTDAGGDYDEENAVCYLQVLLSDRLDCMGRDRMFADMDLWGYSFRLGSSKRWFESDADDARAWLIRHSLLASDGQLSLLPKPDECS